METRQHSFLPSFILGCLATLVVCATAWALLDTSRTRHSISHSETRLAQFLEGMQSGDLLLASGALWMQALSRSHITHVGILYRDASGRWFVFETTRSHKDGAGLTPLAHFLQEWYRQGCIKEQAGNAFGRNSTLWHCRLGARIDSAALGSAILRFRGAPYSMRLWKAFSAHILPVALDLPMLNATEDAVEGDSEMFCSQLAARTLQECGALALSRPCFSFKPDDFWNSHGMPWAPGFAPLTQHHARIVFPKGALHLSLFEAMVARAAASTASSHHRAIREPSLSPAASFFQKIRSALLARTRRPPAQAKAHPP